MTQAILFKILQRQCKFKNPDHLVHIPDYFTFSNDEHKKAKDYLDFLEEKNISYTFPGHVDYPLSFYRMKNPPLFLEFQGLPFWKEIKFLGVVGSRKISEISKQWMSSELSQFLEIENVGIASGGAYGVDQWSHMISLKQNRPTIVVLPCGLGKIYPEDLKQKLKWINSSSERENFCFLSEFEFNQSVQKSFFFHRNRMIAALCEMLLVVEAQISSGTMLTVHHALENGRPILTLPSHPNITGFSGNLKLLSDGAAMITSGLVLSELWQSELYGFCANRNFLSTNSLD